ALETACNKAGVGSPDEARQVFEDRREATSLVDNKSRIEQENLRDLSYEELERKIVALERIVPGYIAERVPEPAICTDLDSAKREWATAQAHQSKANKEKEEARGSADAAREVRDGLSTKDRELRVELNMLAGDLRTAVENLERARKTVADDALGKNLERAVAAVSSEEYKVRTAEEALKERNPERVRNLADTAKGSLQTTQKRRASAQKELTELQTKLKIFGEEGLHEKLHSTRTKSDCVEKQNLAMFQRSSAAKYLYETMRDERTKVRKAYVAPLQERIEYLGRLVFDDPFEVSVSEELVIDSRTLKGVTLPFNYLSGGTKEQLSLIFRVACSMIVAKDGGTPLILDDALGYTDPDRLRLIGAVLAKAAKECQIIIFTCTPERYANIGEAKVVSLG
ncbi:MAG: ATP-binding protein, partial [Planctomycetota bacterium]